MKASRNSNDVCWPRHPKVYKDIHCKIKRPNYSVDNENYIWDWGSSKCTAQPSIPNKKQADQNAYNLCCDGKKIRIRTPKRRKPQDATLNLQEELQRVQSSSLLKDISLHPMGSCAPLSWAHTVQDQQPFLTKEKSAKWWKEHERKLQAEDKAKEELYMANMWQNFLKKREALDKFRQFLESNRQATIGRSTDLGQAVMKPGNNPYGDDHLDQGKPKGYEELMKKSPEQRERALLRQIRKVRRLGKDKQKVRDTGVVYTPFGKYAKSQVNTTPGSLHWIDKPAPHTDPFDKILKGKARLVSELQPLRRSQHSVQTSSSVEIPKKKTSQVGAKFSRNFRNKLRANPMTTAKMSKPFHDLLDGQEGNMTNKMKSPERERELLKQVRKVRKPDKDKQQVRIAGVVDTPFGKYEKIQDRWIPELTNQLKITGENVKRKPQGNTTPRSLSWTNDVGPFTDPLDKMLKGKAGLVPELQPLLNSQNLLQTSSNVKIPQEKTTKMGAKFSSEENKNPEYGTGMSSFEPHKSRLRREPENNYGLHKPGTTRHKSKDMPTAFSGRAKKEELEPPKEGQKIGSHEELGQPESKADLMGDSEIGLETKSHEKSPTETDKFTLTKLPKTLRRNYKVPYFSPIKMHRKKGDNSLDKPIEIVKDPPVSSRKSPRWPLPENNILKLKRFYDYIKNSAPDRRIMEQRDSVRSMVYLGRKSIASMMNEKGRRREMPEKSEWSDGSVISEMKDEENLMFNGVPQHNQDPNKKNTLSELVASIASAEKDRESLSHGDKDRPKPVKSPAPPEAEEEGRRVSGSSLKSVSAEIKQFESQALKHQALREQYQKDFMLEEKAAVQARIQELMKYVAIREDFQPPKPPRDFIAENIEMIQEIGSPKRTQTKDKRKHHEVDTQLKLEHPDSPEGRFSTSKPMRIQRHKVATGKGKVVQSRTLISSKRQGHYVQGKELGIVRRKSKTGAKFLKTRHS